MHTAAAYNAFNPRHWLQVAQGLQLALLKAKLSEGCCRLRRPAPKPSEDLVKPVLSTGLD